MSEAEKLVWDHIVRSVAEAPDEQSLTVRGFTGEPVNFTALGDTERWQNLQSLSLLQMDPQESQPWYDLLYDSPPESLRKLSLGAEYDGLWKIGNATSAVHAVNTIEELDIRGNVDRLQPLQLPNLKSLVLRVSNLPEVEFFEQCSFPKLERLWVSAESGSPMTVMPLIKPPLANLGLGFIVPVELLPSIRVRCPDALAQLTLPGEIGETFEEEKQVIEELLSNAPYWARCALTLTSQIQDEYGATLAGAGLSIEWAPG